MSIEDCTLTCVFVSAIMLVKPSYSSPLFSSFPRSLSCSTSRRTGFVLIFFDKSLSRSRSFYLRVKKRNAVPRNSRNSRGMPQTRNFNARLAFMHSGTRAVVMCAITVIFWNEIYCNAFNMMEHMWKIYHSFTFDTTIWVNSLNFKLEF